MTRVRVDFNSRGPLGTVRGSLRRSDVPFAFGDAVEVYDPDEPDMSFAAIVVGLDPDSGAALFDVDWVREPTQVADAAAAAGVTLKGHFRVASSSFGTADRQASGFVVNSR